MVIVMPRQEQPKPEKYTFVLEVTDPNNGETVKMRWDNLTLLEAKALHKVTANKGSIYDAQAERFGWKEMQ